MVKANAFEAVTRQMVVDIKQDVTDLKTDTNQGFSDIKGQITELFNHQSSRIPQPIAWGMAMLGAVIGAAVMKALGI